nr:hypothetical protein [Prosthecochloris aestuarii]
MKPSVDRKNGQRLAGSINGFNRPEVSSIDETSNGFRAQKITVCTGNRLDEIRAIRKPSALSDQSLDRFGNRKRNQITTFIIRFLDDQIEAVWKAVRGVVDDERPREKGRSNREKAGHEQGEKQTAKGA